MGKSIGIDLGTNNTVVTYENKKGNLVSLKIKGASSRDVIPSVLFFKSDDEWVIGKEAVDLAPLYPQAVIRQFKSHLDDSKYKYAIIAENGDEYVYLGKSSTYKFYLLKDVYYMRTIGATTLNRVTEFNYDSVAEYIEFLDYK